jgi:trimeric autotransporter adhesin
MAGYIGTKAAVVTPGAERKKVFSITTTTTSLTGLAYAPGFVHVFHNGVRLVDGTDYTATNGTSLTLTTAAQNGDEVVVISYATFQTSDTVSASAGGTFSGGITINGSLSVDGGTIKLDGNYPVGTNNVALGNTALDSNVSGASNTAIGAEALKANTTASYNTAVGYQAGYTNATGAITAIGAFAGKTYNTSGTENWGSTFVGVSSGENTNTGVNNAALGGYSLRLNTTGSQNVAIGAAALYSNTTASNNTAVGYQAGYSNTTATHNTFIGRGSGYSTTTGGDNVALGSSALYTNAEGTSNTSIGYSSMYYNTSGTNNVALGKDALQNNTTASNNTAVGYQAGFDNATGVRCTFIGNSAGENSTVSDNTFVGQNSGSAITSGDANTILGRFSGNEGGLDIRTLSNRIVLSDGDGNPRLNFGTQGTGASGWRLFGASHTNTNAIGCGEALQILSENDGSNFFGILINFDQSIHGGNVNNLRFFNRGVGVVGSITSGATSTAYNTSSDYRLKEDLQPMVNSVDRLMALKPVNFAWKTNGDRVDGFLAHEVQDIVPEAIVGAKDAVDADGNPVYQGIDQSKLVPLLTAALQEALTEIASLKARLDAANL